MKKWLATMGWCGLVGVASGFSARLLIGDEAANALVATSGFYTAVFVIGGAAFLSGILYQWRHP